MSLLRYLPKTFDPIRLIEWVVAIATAISGLHIFSPFYDPSLQSAGPGAIAAALHHPDFIYIYATVILIGAILLTVGLVLRNTGLRSSGLFIIFMVRFFQVLLTITAIGVQPITWIFPLTVMFVVVICWINARLEVINNGGS